MHITLSGQQFILSETGAMFWIEQKMLIIADAHFSKENHFRKSGIPIPHGILQSDLKRVESLIDTFQPDQILFLGDMFHSEENEGVNEFLYWRKTISQIKIKLVIGNHDILSRAWYSFAGIEIFEEKLLIDNILLSHDRIKIKDKNFLNLSGHIHPCIILRGKAKQSINLPCFWFSQNHGILPPFGRFTGCKAIKPEKDDLVFGIGEGKIFSIKFPVTGLTV